MTSNSKFKIQPKNTVDFSLGRVPPQAVELEKAVLGASMLQPDALQIAADILKPENFYVSAHIAIFKSMCQLSEKRMPVDLLTVVQQLQQDGELENCGGPYYLSTLTNAVVSSANIETHARIVLQKHIARELIRISSEIIGMAYDETVDIFDALDSAESLIGTIRMGNLKQQFKTLQEVSIQNIVKLEELRVKGEAITGVPSLFNSLDMVTCGWQPSDLIILAARPAVGKTAFALTLAKNAAKTLHERFVEEKKNNPLLKPPGVGFFSLEMSNRQLVNRVLASESDVWLWKFKNGKISDSEMKQIYEGAERLNSCKILLDETAGLPIGEFKSKARQMAKKENVQFIIVDYLQLMTNPALNNREQVISSISQGLKNTAKELNIPIIALSQLNRDIEKNKGKEGKRKPNLSDIRESGAIEQDADMVMFLYKPPESEVESDPDLQDTFFLDIAKHRSGALETFIGKFTGTDQKHHWLKIVDYKTGKAIEESTWKPLNSIVHTTSFYEPKASSGDDGDEAPF